MRRVCWPGDWCRTLAISSRTFSGTRSASLPAVSATVRSRSSVPCARRRSERPRCSIASARSSTPPSIQPDAGCRSALPSAPWKCAAYSNRTASTFASAWDLNLAGRRTVMTPSIGSPVRATCAPSRERASASTVRAGANSVSTTTGQRPVSITRISGRFCPERRTPVDSATRVSRFHLGWRLRSAEASSPLTKVSGLRGPLVTATCPRPRSNSSRYPQAVSPS